MDLTLASPYDPNPALSSAQWTPPPDYSTWGTPTAPSLWPKDPAPAAPNPALDTPPLARATAAAPQNYNTPTATDPNPYPLDNAYVDRIKGFEGYSPNAYADGSQYSIGYGSKATHPGEVLDQAGANQRLSSELGDAYGFVNSKFPNADPGTKAALTSLTYNVGQRWASSGLGDALRSGDMDTAKQRFLEYNTSNGQFNKGLDWRRRQEVQWFGNGPPQGALASANTNPAPQGGPVSDTYSNQGPLSSPNLYGSGALQGGGNTNYNGLTNSLDKIAGYLIGVNNPQAGAGLVSNANNEKRSYAQMMLPYSQMTQAQQAELALKRQEMMKPQVFNQGPDLLGVQRPPLLINPWQGTASPINVQGGGGNGYQGTGFQPTQPLNTGAAPQPALVQAAGPPGPPGSPQAGPPMVQPQQPQAPSPYAADGSQFTQALQDFGQGKINKDQLKAAAPLPVQQEAEGLIAGTADPNLLGSRNPGVRQGGIYLAKALEPGFDENTIAARKKAASSLIGTTTGSLGWNITAAGAMIDHAQSYMQNAQKLEQYRIAGGVNNTVNWMQDLWKKYGNDPEYRAVVNGLNNDADFLAGESVKSATGNQGTWAERTEAKNRMAPELSFKEKQAAVASAIDKGLGRLSPLVNNYNESFQLTGTPRERTELSFLPKGSEDRIRGLLSGNVTATPSASAVVGGGGAAPVAPPAAAIAALKQQPQRAAEFDAKYGQGASKAILGQ